MTPTRLLPIFALLMVAACKPAPEQKFADVKVPPGFTFQMTRGVDVEVSANQALKGKSGLLVLSRVTGGTVLTGQLKPGVANRYRIAVPSAEQSLVAQVTAADGTLSKLELPISANKAVAQFQ